MPHIVPILLTLLSLTACLLASFAVLLEYRMPSHPKWLDGDFVTVPLLLLLSSWAIFSTAFLFQHIHAAGPGTLVALIATPAIFFLLGFFLWKLLGMRRRLEEATAGLSPFHFGRRTGIAH